MNDLERDFVRDDEEAHYESGDEADYEDMPGLINYEDNMDHSNIMHLYGDFNRFNDNENDYDCEEIKAELEAELDTDLDTELKFDLNTDLDAELKFDLNTDLDTELKFDLNTELNTDLDTELNTDLDTDLNTDLNTGLKEIEPTQQEPAINREIEASPKQTCIII